MKLRGFVLALLLPLCSWPLCSCTWRTGVQPSVVVIMVENLGVGAFSCSDGSGTVDSTDTSGVTRTAGSSASGFQIFCDEAVRFTHAYTPSALSQPAVASLLTAKYPFDHGVRNNGAQAISAKEETVAEVAVTQGLRTAFFSGGPPIWRRSGFSQGFEIFDDSITLSLGHLYRPAADVINLFLNWQLAEAPHGSFFSFLYLADPQFIDVPTVNDLGELRESSYSSQLAVVDEALAKLVRQMKARKIWDSSDVYLIGLGANSAEGRAEEIPAMNLFSESTRATLMIKPSRKTREGPFNWKIDSNVSLVDVGATLFDMMGEWAKRKYPLATSLRSALVGPEPTWAADRRVVSESGWAEWQGLGGIRAAVRQGPTLFLFDERSLIYDTLTDNLEVIPLPNRDSTSVLLRGQLSEFLREHGYAPWRSPGRFVADQAELARELWRDRAPDRETLARLRDLSSRHPENAELKGWRAIIALRENDWRELKALAGVKAVYRPLWGFIADRNLGLKSTIPGDSCFAFLRGEKHLARTCYVDGLQDLLTWSDDSNADAVKTRASESFLRFYVTKAIATRIAEQNEVIGREWDTSVKIQEPDILELVLALPEMKRIRHIVKTRVSAERH